MYKLNAKHAVLSGLYYMYIAPTSNMRDERLVSMKTGRAWNKEYSNRMPNEFVSVPMNKVWQLKASIEYEGTQETDLKMQELTSGLDCAIKALKESIQ